MAELIQEDEVVADDTPEPKERSIREEIEAARDEINARDESGDDAGADHSGSPVSDRGDGRGTNGRFASRQAASGADQAVPDKSSQQTQQPENSQSGGEQVPAVSGQQPAAHVALPAPQSWSAQEKQLWSQLPAAAQQIVARREQEAHRRITEHDEIRGVGNQFMLAANEFAPMIQARGGNPVGLFREVLSIINQIHNSDPGNRANIFRQLAAQNGVDLRALGMQSQQSGAQPQNTQQSNVPIDQLVDRAVDQRLQARQRAEAQQREQAEIEATHSEIEAFRSKVDANGQPSFPHFETLTGLMSAILSAGNATTLEEAYQLAVKAHPETSKAIEQQAQAAAQAAEDKRRKAEAARRKGGSLRTGAGSPPQANGTGNRSIGDELRAAFAEAKSRV
jgi:hypothetical protein